MTPNLSSLSGANQLRRQWLISCQILNLLHRSGLIGAYPVLSSSVGNAAPSGRVPVMPDEQVQAFGAALRNSDNCDKRSSRIVVTSAKILLKRHVKSTMERLSLRAFMGRPRKKSVKRSMMRALKYLICRGLHLTINQACGGWKVSQVK